MLERKHIAQNAKAPANRCGANLRGAFVTSLTVFSTCAAASAASVNWAAGQWSHPSQPVADTRYLNEATAGTSVLGEGITVNVAYTPAGGTAGIANRNLTVSNVVNGGVAPDSLRLQQRFDRSTSAGTMDRFSTTSLTFNTPVTTTGFTLFDVDVSDPVGA